MEMKLLVKREGMDTFRELDLPADTRLEMSYGLYDFCLPKAGKRRHRFKLPGTSANNRIFGHMALEGAAGQALTEKPAEACVMLDEMEIYRGGLMLREVAVQVEKVHYVCELMDSIGHFFALLGSHKLSELDLSAFDHFYTMANQSASWTAGWENGYVYPMIDYSGQFLSKDEWRVEDFYPAVYARQYMDKIFEWAGRKYSSAFLKGGLFSRLIVPFQKGSYPMSNGEKESREFKAGMSDVQPLNCSAAAQNYTIAFDLTASDGFYDISGLFDTGLHLYNVSEAGYYNIRIAVKAALCLHPAGSGHSLPTDHTQAVTLRLRKSGSSEPVGNKAEINFTVPEGTVLTDDYRTPARKVMLSMDSIYLAAGEQLYAEATMAAQPMADLNYSTDGAAWGAGISFMEIMPGSVFMNKPLERMTEGMQVEMQKVIPEHIMMCEFLEGIMKLFNLYMEEDRERPGTFMIEPAETFFTDERINWQQKQDVSQRIRQSAGRESRYSRFLYRYSTDSDALNSQYQEKFGGEGRIRTYGDHLVENEAGQADEMLLITPVFAATPLAEDPLVLRPMPVIYHESNDDPMGCRSHIRLLYYGGLKATGDWKHISRDGTANLLSSYPFAGHVDDPGHPEIDLSFGKPEKYYWHDGSPVVTGNNLYNLYHRKILEASLSPEAGRFAASFVLGAKDLMQLSFRKLYYFNGGLFRLEKVAGGDGEFRVQGIRV